MGQRMHRLPLQAARRYLAANDLRVQDGKILTPTGVGIGRAVEGGDVVLLIVFEEGYSRGDTHVTAWWPHFRPSYILVGGSDAETGPTLGPDEAICDFCNGDILIRPVPVTDGYALCRSCFERMGLDFPGTIRPYVPAALAWRDNELGRMLSMYCDVHCTNEIYVLRGPGEWPRENRWAFEMEGLMTPDGDLTRAGKDLLERIEAILQLRWQPDPPVGRIPAVFRPHPQAVADAGLQATHAGALYFLARRPGCTWGFLSKRFGPGVLAALTRRDLALGERRRGAPWYPSKVGVDLLREIIGREE